MPRSRLSGVGGKGDDEEGIKEVAATVDQMRT